MTTVYCGGVFDLLHRGHILLIRRAKAMGDHLTVGVQEDAYCKRPPVMSVDERVATIEALGIADEVITYEESAYWPLRHLRPDIFLHGNDWPLQTDRTEIWRLIEELGIEVRLLPRTDGISTSAILERLATRSAN